MDGFALADRQPDRPYTATTVLRNRPAKTASIADQPRIAYTAGAGNEDLRS